MLNKRSIILLKNEVTYRTDPTPTGAADSLLVENLNWSFTDARMNERPATRASLGALAPVYGGTLIQITFDAELKGSGAAGTAPDLGQALQACAMAETVVPATSVTYLPASSSKKSCTIYFYRDGKRFICTGCVGMVSGSLVAGAYGKLSFTFVGHLVSEADAALPTPTYDATEPPAIINLSNAQLDSTTFALSKLDFDLGNEVARTSDIVQADGFGVIEVTGRKVTGSIDPQDVLVATYNWLDEWQSGNDLALTSGGIGGTAGNIITVSFPGVRLTEQSPGDASGIVTRELTFQAIESSGDDEISIAFT